MHQEHLFIGQFGQIAILVLFVFSILSFLGFYKTQTSIGQDKSSWLKFGKLNFWISSLASFFVFACIFIILKNHHYEYKYAYEHSNNIMPSKFLLSAIWEGQEGSFLLWIVWTAVLGLILQKSKSPFVTMVMAVIALLQICLSTMIIGLHVGDFTLGSSPFILFKDAFANIPFIKQNPNNYLQMLTDGNGLNPLLQNYWMVIHPPVLFLGFAATVIPFGFVISGMVNNDYDNWIKECMPWTSFATGVLGLGIMMGAAWAYEALSFGGYWAWDPVENASLVPWLLLVSSMHTLIIYKATGHSMRVTILFFLLSFILVIYSTFLTRSGILGDTSVHAFTDLGMNVQLIGLLLVFTIPSLLLYILKIKSIPAIKKEEATNSREFWMFIGALILVLSAIHITFFTSLPVWNKLFGTNWALPEDKLMFYNKAQIWFAIGMLVGTSMVHFLKFKNTTLKYFWSQVWLSISISFIVTLVLAYGLEITEFGYLLLLFSSILAIIGNGYLLIKYFKNTWYKNASIISHIGFGIMLLGILISSYKKRVISLNMSGVGIDMQKENAKENAKESGENLLLFKQIPSSMLNYSITYVDDSLSEPDHFYKVEFQKIKSDLKVVEKFALYPYVQFNPNMGGMLSNPDTKHYWNMDVYTYITKAPDKSKTKNDSLSTQNFDMAIGDTAFFTNGFMVLKNITNKSTNAIDVEVELDVRNLNANQYTIKPKFKVINNIIVSPVDTLKSMNLYTSIENINGETRKTSVKIVQPSIQSDYVVIKSLLFPYINLVWLGTIIMTIGFGLSMWKRRK